MPKLGAANTCLVIRQLGAANTLLLIRQLGLE